MTSVVFGKTWNVDGYPYFERLNTTELRADPEIARYTNVYDWVHQDMNLELNSYTLVDGSRFVYDMGMRMRTAMGLSNSSGSRRFGEFRVPNYRTYTLGLGHSMWRAVSALNRNYPQFYCIVPVSEHHEGKRSTTNVTHKNISGFMCMAMSVHEYAVTLWNDTYYDTKSYVPDLYDDSTFGAWLSLLPQPVSLTISSENLATLSWAADEPRAHSSKRMGRYLLSKNERTVSFRGYSWRNARAEVYVRAWEKMASNEPVDRYESLTNKTVADVEEAIKSSRWHHHYVSEYD